MSSSLGKHDLALHITTFGLNRPQRRGDWIDNSPGIVQAQEPQHYAREQAYAW